MIEKIVGAYKDQGWRKIEERVLSLIQLWADTFMMKEGEFPSFMKIYRELRKEGIVFPPRDPNERFMINFEGDPSPAFELADMEQAHLPPVEEKPIEKRTLKKDVELQRSELENLKKSLKALESFLCKATNPKELEQPQVKELVNLCSEGQKKILELVSYKTSEQSDENLADLIESMEFINKKIETFKDAANLLRKGANTYQVQNLFKSNENFLQEHSVLEGLNKYATGYANFEEQKLETAGPANFDLLGDYPQEKEAPMFSYAQYSEPQDFFSELAERKHK